MFKKYVNYKVITPMRLVTVIVVCSLAIPAHSHECPGGRCSAEGLNGSCSISCETGTAAVCKDGIWDGYGWKQPPECECK